MNVSRSVSNVCNPLDHDIAGAALRGTDTLLTAHPVARHASRASFATERKGTSWACTTGRSEQVVVTGSSWAVWLGSGGC